jgi:outer membrane receptor protein involved in Fe transport
MYGKAFRAPPPEDALSAFGTFTGQRDAAGRYLGTGFRVPNYNLMPEKSRTWSATWEWRPRSNLSLATNLYFTKIDNLITTLDEQIPTQYLNGALLSQSTIKGNAGSERHYGLDVLGQWRFELGRGWSGDLWGSWTHVAGEIREGLDSVNWDLPYIASDTLKLGTTFRYQDRYTITPKLQWVGDTNTGRKSKTALGERLQTPGYTVANLHLGAHRLLADHNLSAYLDIYNLFDKRYYAAHGSASSTFVGVPQQPRTLMVSAEYRF